MISVFLGVSWTFLSKCNLFVILSFYFVISISSNCHIFEFVLDPLRRDIWLIIYMDTSEIIIKDRESKNL